MKKHTQQGFTLIELLVVITIIAILMGLAIPAVSTALQAAKRTEAATMINQLRAALTSYQTEYNTYPGCLTPTAGGDILIAAGDGETDWQKLYEVLTATPGNGSTTIPPNITDYNSRRIVFMEIPPKYAGTGSIKTILDPWGNRYGLAIDANFDNQLVGVPDPAEPDAGVITINGSYALWTFGVDDLTSATPTEKKKSMVSTYK